jgi:hypothetical protein
VQPQSTRQFLQIVEVISYRRFGAQPLWFRLAQRPLQFDLDELRHSCHEYSILHAAIPIRESGERNVVAQFQLPEEFPHGVIPKRANFSSARLKSGFGRG